METIYTVLYTHQKTKKAKTWQDGTLKVLATGTKAVLYDDKGCKLDALHVHARDVITGEQLESDRYYIQVEEIQKQSCSLPVKNMARFPQDSQSSAVQSRLDQSQPERLAQSVAYTAGVKSGAGLKRKRNGFMPPRQVKPRAMEDEMRNAEPDAIFPSYSSNNAHQNIQTIYQGKSASQTLHNGLYTFPTFVSNEHVTLDMGRDRMSVTDVVPTCSPCISPGLNPCPQIQAPVVKNSPWRTFGQSSISKSPLLQTLPSSKNSSPGTFGRILNSAPDITEGNSFSHSPTFVSNTNRSVSSREAFQRNPGKPGSRRSASEIIALLGKKKAEEEHVDTGSLQTARETSKNTTFTVNITPGQPSDRPRMLEGSSQFSASNDSEAKDRQSHPDPLRTGSKNDLILEDSFHASMPSEKTAKLLPYLSSKIDPHGDNSSPLSYHWTNMKTELSPELSGSTVSISKHEFEEEMGGIDAESISSRSLIKSSSLSEVETSHDFSDLSQTEHIAAVPKSEEIHYDFISEGNDNSVVSSEKELTTSNSSCFQQNIEISQEIISNNLFLKDSFDKSSKTDRNVGRIKPTGDCEEYEAQLCSSAAGAGTGDAYCTDGNEASACFEMNLSPLSEEAELNDENESDFLNGDREGSGEKLSPYLTESSDIQHTGMKMYSPGYCSVKCSNNSGMSEEQALQNSDTTRRLTEKLSQDETSETKYAAKECDITVTDTETVKQSNSRDFPRVNLEGNKTNTLEEGKTDLDFIHMTEMMKTGQDTQEISSSQSVSLTAGDIENEQYRKCITVDCSDKSRNKVDHMKTLEDLYMSPDSETFDQPSGQHGCDSLPPPLIKEKQMYPVLSVSNANKDKLSPDDISCFDHGQYVHEAQTQDLSQTDKQKNAECSKSLCLSQSNKINAMVLSCSSPNVSPFDCSESKLSISSPTSFGESDCSLSPYCHAAEKDQICCSSESSDRSNKQTCIPVGYKQMDDHMCETVENQVAGSAGPNVYQQGILASPQSTLNDAALQSEDQMRNDMHMSSFNSHPVLRVFQTMSEVFCESEKRVQMLGCKLSCVDYDEDPALSVLGQKSVEVLKSGLKREPVKHMREECGNNDHHPVSSTLPHPDKLLRGSNVEMTFHGNLISSSPASDISQTISAQLSGYKMQGMVASDVVERPMAYVHQAEEDQKSFPWISSHSSLRSFHAGKEINLRSGEDNMSHYDSAQADENLISELPGGKTDTYMPPESRLIPPAYENTVPKFLQGLGMYHDGVRQKPTLHPITSVKKSQENCNKVFDNWHPENDLIGQNMLTDCGSSTDSAVLVSASSERVDSKRSAGEDQCPHFSDLSQCEQSLLLFSQNIQSQLSVVPPEEMQRHCSLKPFLTSPDQITTCAGNARMNIPTEGNKNLPAEDVMKEFIQVPPARQNQRIDLTDSDCCDGISSLNKSKTISLISNPVDCSTMVEEKKVQDNIDFSGFTDSFPEEDHLFEENQLFGSEMAINSLSCNKTEAGGQTDANGGYTTGKEDTNIDDFDWSVDNDGLVFRGTGGQARNCSGADNCLPSSSSSQCYDITNTGLDQVEKLEAEERVDYSIVRDHQEASLAHCDTRLKKKASWLASQFQTSCAHSQSHKTENLSQLGPRKSYTGQGFIKNSFTGNFVKSYKSAPDVDNLLVPSAPTNSPPLDISPGRTPERCAVLTDCSNQHPTLKKMDSPLHRRLPSRFAHKDFSPALSVHHKRQLSPDRSDLTYTVSQPHTDDRRFPDSKEVTASKTVGLRRFKRPNLAISNKFLPHSQFQSSLCQELQWSGREEVEGEATLSRQVIIPSSFDSVASYKHTLTAALTEFVNIQLFGLAKSYHCALSKVDVSAVTEGFGMLSMPGEGSNNPACRCGNTAKVVQVKKEGPNTGRFFYACSAPRGNQCKFFQWVDQQKKDRISSKGGTGVSLTKPKLSDSDSTMGYFRGQSLLLYCQCYFVCRSENQQRISAWFRNRDDRMQMKRTIFIRLPKRDSAVKHAKDDLWIISKSLNFSRGETFVARSTFHGPNAQWEVAVDPLSGFSPSLWADGCVCHAVHGGNAATELTCMANIQDHIDMTSLPILSHLLSKQHNTSLPSKMSSKGFRAPTVLQEPGKLHVPAQFVNDLAAEFITKYNLNADQAQALQHAADMMNKDADSVSSVLLIHGVFGAGKSFLLSVLILFLVEFFHRNNSNSPGIPFPWKILLSSTTNVAVDRVLQGLLELGFDGFVRVGSVKKIAKQVLPYSVHASGSDSQELRDLQEMLKSKDITPAEKHCVRKSIEKQRLGENRKRLGAVLVVGVTCAACSFQCLDKMKFPFVVLDECSQMTEPASLLPIARFACEKLVLVGDPKQLDPTLQGSDAAHGEGLEQTMFDRLIKVGYEPVMLRTQYRCHPVISAISNSLFYENQLLDGVTADDRRPLLEIFPTLCFYDVSGGQEQADRTGSFTNEAEAHFVCLLLSVFIMQGLQAASIGVITLYRAQARQILDIIRQSKSGAACEMTGVQVSTVDAFQGGERDVIILSCVRTHSVGFIDCDKRMNVALTRARHHLLIVGHQRNLCSNRRWTQVIGHCHGVPDGVMSASAAGRHLQAVLEKASGGQQDDNPPNTQRKHSRPVDCKAIGNNDSKELELIAAASCARPASEVSPSLIPHQVSSNERAHMEESSFESFVKHDEKSVCVERLATQKHKSCRIKPLVIDDSDDSSDTLPEGL